MQQMGVEYTHSWNRARHNYFVPNFKSTVAELLIQLLSVFFLCDANCYGSFLSYTSVPCMQPCWA